MKKTALITMPFAPADMPSIQLGILKSLCNKVGIAADDYYLNLDFYRVMAAKGLADIYSSTLPSLLSEWFFSKVPFEDKGMFETLEARQRLEQFAGVSGIKTEKLFEIRNKLVPEFIDSALKGVDWKSYGAVAFTMSYAQLNASFRMAEKIKEVNPEIKTLFGGAFSQIHENSIEEFMKAYPFIDYFILGEAEPVFTELLERIFEGKEPGDDLPGIWYRSKDKIITTGGVSYLTDMSRSVIPDYMGCFKKVSSFDYSIKARFKRTIPIEMSRGCYWGQKKPCTFCAFYPCRDFRPKETGQIIEEMKTQAKSYVSGSFYIVDAAVTGDMIEEVFPRFEEVGRAVSIPFVELRTVLKEKHVKIMADSGVKMTQPGIECLEKGLLKKINKGVSLYNNLLFLKWSRKHGLRTSWNLILGLPDATLQEVENQLRIIKKLEHLDPPFPMPLSLVRFSTYLNEKEKYPLKDIKPDDFYRFIHPPGIDVEKAAYEFTASLDLSVPGLTSTYQRTFRFIDQWRRKWQDTYTLPVLEIIRKEAGAKVRDGRKSPRRPLEYELNPFETDVYMACMNRPGIPDSIKKHLEAETERENVDLGEIKRVLDDFAAKDLVLLDGELWFSLAVEKENP